MEIVAEQRYETRYSLCDRQKIVPVHALVVVYFIICTYPTCIDHYTTRLVSLGVQEVVAF